MTLVIDLTEWETADPGDRPGLQKALSERARKVATALTESGRLRIAEMRQGLRIQTRSHVGAVDLRPVQMRIRPKIAADAMPAFMRYALELRQVEIHDTADSAIQSRGFLDILGIAVRDEVDEIVRAGVERDYRQTEEWTGRPRGAILFMQMGRHPLRSQVSLPYRSLNRTADLPVNQIIGACLTALRPAVSAPELAFDLHAREAMFGELCRRRPLTRDLLAEAQHSLDRRSAYYMSIVHLAAFVLAGMGTSFMADETACLPGFLFDMNALFEHFVARLCAEYAPPGLTVTGQDTLSTAYTFAEKLVGWQTPRLRPDIVVRDAMGTPRIILGTKYKRFNSKARPSPADIYQLTLYSVAYVYEYVVPAQIVYPATSSMPTARMHFRSFNDRWLLGDISIQAIDVDLCARALQKRDDTALREIVAALLSS